MNALMTKEKNEKSYKSRDYLCRQNKKMYLIIIKKITNTIKFINLEYK
jgi:hypothetical protein